MKFSDDPESDPDFYKELEEAVEYEDDETS